ncbi:MAG: hypothetical protein N3A63_00095 [Bacteroidetes bacterium]|nr:hypothetical protein [Bacteroidota bacterium]
MSLFKFIALATLIIFSGCSKNDSTVVDSLGALPYVHTVTVTPSVLNTDTILVGSIRIPNDTLTARISIIALVSIDPSIDIIEGVHYRIISHTENVQLTAGSLDFQRRLSTKEYYEYSSTPALRFLRSLVGQFHIEIWATTKKGYQSITKLVPFTIIRQNQPPVISDLSILDPDFTPVDTVYTYKYNRLYITVKVYDPDGNIDIYKVYRITQAGNKYELNDKGVNGDLVAGNGIYTETIGWSNPQEPKSDIFKFVAIDRSLDSSNVIIRPIVVLSQ